MIFAPEPREPFTMEEWFRASLIMRPPCRFQEHVIVSSDDQRLREKVKGLIYYLILKKKGEVEGGGHLGTLNPNVTNTINWAYLRD